MTIFKDINELKNCVMEWGEILSHDDYLSLLKEIDNSKSYDLFCNIGDTKSVCSSGFNKPSCA